MELARRLWRVLRSRLPTRGPGLGIEIDPLDEAPAAEHRQGHAGSGRRAGGPTPAPARDEELARCYANLEVPYGADLETCRKAWRRLMKRYHPDRHGEDPERKRVATELTRELTRAYRQIEGARKPSP